MSPSAIIALIQAIFQLAGPALAALEAALAGNKSSAAELPPQALNVLRQVVAVHKALAPVVPAPAVKAPVAPAK